MPKYFKPDSEFSRNLSIGAACTNATIARLKEMGFNPIELERGAASTKIWKKLKIKGKRVPDILCLDTGLRFESRGKRRLQISMSHSIERPWNTDMRDDDWVSIAAFEESSNSPLGWKRISPVYFIEVADLGTAFADGQLVHPPRKSNTRGYEKWIGWPCVVAKQKATVTSVDASTMSLTPTSGGAPWIVPLQQRIDEMTMFAQAKPEDIVEANQIVASVVPVYLELPPQPTVDEAYYNNKLSGGGFSEKYAAAKALRYRGYTDKSALETCMNERGEHSYVRLEAAATLAVYDDPAGWEFIRKCSTTLVSAEIQLETMIILSGIPGEQSKQLLLEVEKDTRNHSEIRAGAKWALEQFV